jgi:formate hydrogenlyase subunit 7
VRLLRKIVATGRVTEAMEADTADTTVGAASEALLGEPRRRLRGSLQVRHVDAGSCNGCEVEIASTFGPVYDAERFGVRLVASPRHADALVVTGPVTRNMAVPLRKALEATPAPKLVIALGDCACDGGVFRDGYGVVGPVSAVVGVDHQVPGCPPEPATILRALRQVTGR